MADEAKEPSFRVVGEKPRPRTLIRCDDDTLAAKLCGLVPHHRRIDDNALDVHQDEWDLLIAVGQLPAIDLSYPASHIDIISFGASEHGLVHRQPPLRTTVNHYAGTSLAQELRVPDLAAPLSRLVRDDLLPKAQQAVEHRVLSPMSVEREVVLLQTNEPRTIAAARLRGGEKAWVWILPDYTSRHAEWVVTIMQVMRTVNPEKYAQIPGWQQEPRWSTIPELELIQQLEGLAERVEVFNREAEADRARFETDLAKARADAEEGLRLLLTSDGDELSNAVRDALLSLGFEVDDMDSKRDEKLEDLRVRDPDAPGWEALVEVKGYRGAARTSDLQKIGRFRDRYRDEEDRWPDSCWYVVNQMRGQDPRGRPPILGTNESDLAIFAETRSGLAMDTTTLFRMTIDVAAGLVDPGDVRRQLRESTGRLAGPTFPDDETTDAGDP